MWVTLKVPLHAASGTYRGEAKLLANVGSATKSVTVPLVVNLYDAAVDKSRLLVTNWFR